MQLPNLVRPQMPVELADQLALENAELLEPGRSIDLHKENALIEADRSCPTSDALTDDLRPFVYGAPSCNPIGETKSLEQPGQQIAYRAHPSRRRVGKTERHDQTEKLLRGLREPTHRLHDPRRQRVVQSKRDLLGRDASQQLDQIRRVVADVHLLAAIVGAQLLLPRTELGRGRHADLARA